MPESKVEHRDAWVEVDLDAIVANAGRLASLCASGCRSAPVVKANAYGHGAVPVSRALVDAGFDALCVATLDEALELRSAGIGVRILLLYEPPARAIGEALDARVEVTLGTREGLMAARALSATDRRRIGIQLKLDTGMSRQGLRHDRIEEFEDDLRALAGAVVGVWSHLSNGADRVVTTAQLGRFDLAVGWLRGLGIDAERHTSGSAGILAGLGTAYEMARPGLAVYGVVPAEWADSAVPLPIELVPAMAVRARPVRAEDLEVGARVGYGGTFEVTEPTQVTLLPVGYADGLRRSLGNGRSCVIHSGVKLPVVGRVSMDSCTVDTTALGPGRLVDRDSVFTLVGSDLGQTTTIEELARTAATVPQEILLGFDDRLPFVYLNDRSPE